MGRRHRNDGSRRIVGVGPVARTARGVSLESLLELLEVASVSPTACNRLPSLALIFDSAIKRTRTGSQQASVGLLPKLVRAAHREDRKLRRYEERFLPHDPGSELVVRWRERLYRLPPGSLVHPAAVVENLRMVADVIDPVLVEHSGFGLGDAVELVLRRVDHVASVLAPTWSARTQNPKASPRINHRELDAAGRLLSFSEQVGSCHSSGRAQRALEFFSTDSKGLPFNPAGGVSRFGATVAVETNPGEFVPLPAGMLVDSLSELGAVLAKMASDLDCDVEKLWQIKMEPGVAYMLAGSGHPVVRQVKTTEGGPAHWVVVYSPRQVLVVDVVAGLRRSSLMERMKSGIQSLDRVASGADLIANTKLPISPDATPFTVQIVAHPEGPIQMPLGDHAAMNWRVFMWIVRTAARHPEDLWYFLRDLTTLKQETELVFSDLADVWETWRTAEKSFPLGRPPRGMFVAPYWQAEAEWDAASTSAPIERALLSLGLPQLSAWPIFDNTGDSSHLGDRNLPLFCQVLPWDVPVVVAMTSFEDPFTDSDMLWALAEGIVWKLKHMKEAFLLAAEMSDLKTLHVGFDREVRDAGESLRMAERIGSMVVLGWNSDLLRHLGNDSLAVEARAGRLLAEAFDSPAARQTFITGWAKAPPGVRGDPMPFPANAQKLPEPEKSHPSQIAALNRLLGEHLAAVPIRSGTYQGDRAKKIVNDSVYPWALDELHSIIQPYSAEGLLFMAFTQLERANFKRMTYLHRLGFRRGFPVHVSFEAGSGEDRRLGMVELCKAISLILEETLARPPDGDNPADLLVWKEALPVAQMAYTSCFRSETLHLGLIHAAVIVTDRFEVHFREADKPTDIDIATHNQRRAAETLPEPVPIHTPTGDEDSQSHDPGPLRERNPNLAKIDEALRDEMGFGLDALAGVLWIAGSWEVPYKEPFAATSRSHFADIAASEMPDVSREECWQAIGWLTLTQEDLQAETREYWETERRAARIDTRPFVEYGSCLYILPWTAMATFAVLSRYLADGRLPWPRTLLPKGVNDALANYRRAKNKQLEKDCLDLFANTDLVVLGNVKPKTAKSRYGFDSLYGEIDLLCLDTEKSRIWVVEAKDPSIPFSAHQMRQSITRFHSPDGHVGKLLRKTEDVERNASRLAEALSVQEPDREWDTRSLMVTRGVNPAAFAVNSRVPFCTIGHLRDVILLAGEGENGITPN